jgi:hypothetical protein
MVGWKKNNLQVFRKLSEEWNVHAKDYLEIRIGMGIEKLMHLLSEVLLIE